MTGLVRETSSQVHIDAATVDLLGADLCTDHQPAQWVGGLLAADPSGEAVRIVCGQEVAAIHVTAQLWDGPPPLTGPEAWQDIAEVSVDWRSPMLDFGTTGDGRTSRSSWCCPSPAATGFGCRPATGTTAIRVRTATRPRPC
ncbi:hypothetical protein [Streptomyces sp. NPDC096152]|uniref:hypothetical protein n=1 Tax=Streptomyces sp. NPDC096152 TaxID=3366078 RepID=UPI003830ADB3